MKKYAIIIALLFGSYIVNSQCAPPSALECSSSPVLCSLDELDGYACQNIDQSNPTGPSPLCPGQGGVAHNTSWWAFVGNGAFIQMTFQLTVADCFSDQGIQVGIVDDCNGGSFDCNAGCNVDNIILQGQTINCHTYYIWVDGCNADVCDFTISVNGGAAPSLPKPLPKPYLEEPACVGQIAEICVEKLTMDCDPKLSWTVDGEDQIDFDDYYCLNMEVFASSSPIEVCVTFTIGNPTDPISICDQETTCFVIIPQEVDTTITDDVYVCWEDHKGNGYTWHDTTILQSDCIDIVVQDTTGCNIIEHTCIILLPEKEVAEIYHFICDKYDLPYITEDGKEWSAEACGENIVWQDSMGCDTSYLLYLTVLNPSPNLTRSCGQCDDTVRIESSPEWDFECTVGAINMEQYWTNEMGDTLGHEPTLDVSDEGNYYLHLEVEYENPLMNLKDSCTLFDSAWVINVTFDEPSISGDDTICTPNISRYTLNYPYQNQCDQYNWSIKSGDGMIINGSKDSSFVDIEWANNQQSDVEVCVDIYTQCLHLRVKCLKVVLTQTPKITAKDSTVCGASINLKKSKYSQKDVLKMISGPGNSSFNYNNLENSISVDEFGKYKYSIESTNEKCVVTQEINIEFIDFPRWKDPIIVCDSMGENYRIILSIVGGDPFTTVGMDTSGWKVVPIGAGNDFITPWIKSEEGVSILFYDDNGCPSPRLDTSFKCTPVSVLNTHKLAISIYPNPAYDYIQITSHEDGFYLNEMNIQIINIEGRVISAPPKSDISGGVLLSIDNLASGIYYIRINNKENTEVLKFVKM